MKQTENGSESIVPDSRWSAVVSRWQPRERLATNDYQPVTAPPQPRDSASARPSDENPLPLSPPYHWLPGTSKSRHPARFPPPDPARHRAYSCPEPCRES